MVISLIVYIGHKDLIFIFGKVVTLATALPDFVYLCGFWNEHLQSTGHNPGADWRLACHFTVYLYRLGWISFNNDLARLPVLDDSLSSLQSNDKHVHQSIIHPDILGRFESLDTHVSSIIDQAGYPIGLNQLAVQLEAVVG